MVLWSHVAASVWLPLAMPVPHQDPVPLLHHGDNGSVPSTKLPWRPPSQDLLLGSRCTSFQRVFHSWGKCASGTWKEREGGCPQRTPLSPSCSSAPSECSTSDARRVKLVKLVSSSTIKLPQDVEHPDQNAETFHTNISVNSVVFCLETCTVSLTDTPKLSRIDLLSWELWYLYKVINLYRYQWEAAVLHLDVCHHINWKC